MRGCSARPFVVIGLLLSLALPVSAQVPPAAMPGPTSPEREASDADSAVGYIDSALLRSQIRLRYDATYGLTRPDRAEFFYSNKTLAVPEKRVNYQEAGAYLEALLTPRLSGFVNVPVRFLNPENNENNSGLSDIDAGLKLALIKGSDLNATFQFRTFAPTGASSSGLSTDHVSLEPALLANYRLFEALTLEAELRYWTPIGGSDFAGDVVRYGIGLSYGDHTIEPIWFSPVAEFVGWTVLGGKESDSSGVSKSAKGDTILNAKVGIRAGVGDRCDWYAGYGRALTGTTWYTDDFRVEFRLFF